MTQPTASKHRRSKITGRLVRKLLIEIVAVLMFGDLKDLCEGENCKWLHVLHVCDVGGQTWVGSCREESRTYWQPQAALSRRCKYSLCLWNIYQSCCLIKHPYILLKLFICLSVEPEHNLKKTKDPKVFKLGIGNDFGVERSRSEGQ